MKTNAPTTLLTHRLANAELVLRQLRQLALHIPCQFCEEKGGENIEPDGGCRHRGSIENDTLDLSVVEKFDRLLRRSNPRLSACHECLPPVGTEVAELSLPSSNAQNT